VTSAAYADVLVVIKNDLKGRGVAAAAWLWLIGMRGP
jgi:hypothetical protein